MKVPVVCLVGSSRFKEEFRRLGHDLEVTGHLTLCMTFFQHADGVDVSEQDRAVLERVDRARIDLADEVLVVNGRRARCPDCKAWHDERRSQVGVRSERSCRCPTGVQPWERIPTEYAPYVGPSTQQEIDYALSRGKKVRYLHTPEEVVP